MVERTIAEHWTLRTIYEQHAIEMRWEGFFKCFTENEH